ncbi:MAG: homoserine dehydrogenase [Lachnospiraceae bacterium]|nr:homoserine dehydrogenase [Lachnospiraceae bacterium]
MIKVAVFGYGTVGSGVVDVIDDNNELISKRIGDDICVKYILDIREFPGDRNESKIVHDVNVILDDPEVSIICETMGGTKFAYPYTKSALEKGKSVCTSNKELVAAYGPELLETAKANNCSYLFEASVGGGIPIIRPMNTSLAPEHIEKIIGILNGTTNYMLTKMAREGSNYDDVLKEAQDKGYAERNPEADVEGYDACRKIAILSSLMTGKTVNYENIYTEGITKLTAIDFEYAAKLDRSIKLLGIAEDKDGKLAAMVAPFMIGREHPLNGVNDVFNAIYVTGNKVDDVMFYGKGAGMLPTASAVVSDVVECARNMGRNISFAWSDEKAPLADFKDNERSFFVRIKQNAKDEAKEMFADAKEVEGVSGEYAFVTAKMSEREFDDKIVKLSDVINIIRIEE